LPAVTLLCKDLTLTARMVIVWSVVFSRERSATGCTRGRQRVGALTLHYFHFEARPIHQTHTHYFPTALHLAANYRQVAVRHAAWADCRLPTRVSRSQHGACVLSRSRFHELLDCSQCHVTRGNDGGHGNHHAWATLNDLNTKKNKSTFLSIASLRAFYEKASLFSTVPSFRSFVFLGGEVVLI
jgi:hypothetical protein